MRDDLFDDNSIYDDEFELLVKGTDKDALVAEEQEEQKEENIEVQQNMMIDNNSEGNLLASPSEISMLDVSEFAIDCEPVQQSIQMYDFSAENINPENDSFIKDFKYTWRFDQEKGEYHLHNNASGKTSKELTGKTYVYVRPDLLLNYFGDRLSIRVEEISTQFIIHVKMNTGETLSIVDNVISASKGFIIYEGKLFKYRHDVASVTRVFEFIRTLDEKVFEGITQNDD